MFTLILCCYLNTIFEFSDIEEKSNFENETHSYIQQDTQVLNTTYSKIVLQLDKVIVNKQAETINLITVCISDNNDKIKYVLPPPEHRYILYSSLII